MLKESERETLEVFLKIIETELPKYKTSYGWQNNWSESDIPEHLKHLQGKLVDMQQLLFSVDRSTDTLEELRTLAAGVAVLAMILADCAREWELFFDRQRQVHENSCHDFSEMPKAI